LVAAVVGTRVVAGILEHRVTLFRSVVSCTHLAIISRWPDC
jgi:hypothetical protein